ncbi:MAG: undecaprenyl-diphosphate phosphatase [Clostridia bacterium]|nr:undecaprenyl-diphosphate phosphatase [Clostridia bacterium]
MARFVEILKIILLGIVEGITEWLPVSSTGHMIILDKFISHSMSDELFEMLLVVIQLGAVLAVPIFFRDKILSIERTTRGARISPLTLRLWGRVLLATLPAALLGLLLDDFLTEHLFNPTTVAIALVLYGAAFILLEHFRGGKASRVEYTEDISARDAFAVGLAQTLSLIPGTSRSGATIFGGMLLGLSRSAAAELSFLMAIPVMLGASLLKILKFFGGGLTLSAYEALLILVGALAAFLVSLFCIRFLMRFVKEHSFTVFGIYRIILGLVILGIA